MIMFAVTFPVWEKTLAHLYSLVEKTEIMLHYKPALKKWNISSMEKCYSHKNRKKQHNNNPSLGENDRGTYHHSTSSSFHTQDLWMPSGCWRLISVLLFLFFIPTQYPVKSLSCKVAWLKGHVVCCSSPQSPEAVGPTTGGILFPLTPDPTCKRSSTASCRQVSSFLLWHGHYDALWMACQSPMVASQLVMCRGR